MTNKEAIEVLNNWDMACPICEKRKSEEKGACSNCRFNNALNFAIKALEEKPFEINVFLENADESTLFDIKKELARILTDRAEREAYEEARREAMRLDDNEDTAKWRGHA